MPRRHGSARDRAETQSAQRPAGLAPGWAQLPGHAVREVTGDREYRCPGCDQLIRPGTAHLVVVPDGSEDLRRHWHTPCWRQHLRRGR